MKIAAMGVQMHHSGRGALVVVANEDGRVNVMAREREIESVANTSLGRSAAAVMKPIANAGKSLGSPWTQDQKKAALAAWMALHEHKGGTLISRRSRR